MKHSLLTAAIFSVFASQAEIVEPISINNALGADQTMDYSLLQEMGPWDDRNYQLTKKDLSILPKNDQYLANVPVFFKIQYRKEHPETGEYYPRSLLQNFQGNYGGLLVDGVWYKEGLGIETFLNDSYGQTSQEAHNRLAASEVALQTGVLGDESAISCNPVNPNNCIAGTNATGGQRMYYSNDSGVTWTFSRLNPANSCCDPWTGWSSNGNIAYQADLRRVGSAIGVRWAVSTDQGITWGPMNDITTTGSDKEYGHVDHSPTSPHLDNIYMTWHDGNVMQFARSTNFGASFSTPISFSSEPRGIGSDITTDAAGNVYYIYPSTGTNASIRLLKSTNGGASFASSTQVAALNGSFDVAIPSMESRRAFIYTSAAVSPTTDDIYVAYTDEENDSAGGSNPATNHTWIRVAKSTNGGSSWTNCAIPHNTSDSIAAGNAEDRYHPWLEIGDDGTLHVGYYDTRHSANRTGVDFYYSTSTNDCASWTETRFSSQTSPNLNDGQEWGDYNGLALAMNKVAMTWTDNRSGKATFVGTEAIGGGNPPTNNAPNASFTSSCTNLSCNFNASGSSDSDGSITNYSWSFGGSGVTASNTFSSAGTFNVTLTVTDNDGATDIQTRSVTVTAPPTGGNQLTNGVPLTGLADSRNGQERYTLTVPAGATNLSFSMSGGSGDADLYVRFGTPPTLSSYDCRPFRNGNNETCNISNVQAGTYHVMLVGYSAYSGTSLTGSFTANGGGNQQSLFSNTSNVNIPDNNSTGATSNISVNRTGASGTVEITYSINHTYRGDLTVQLIDPNGTVSTLRNRSGGSANNINESKTVNKGTTSATGTWGLKVIDSANIDTGFIDSWSIEFL